ncbi:and domain-containing protein [Nannochloropsis gaditana CCMP526]|uniref:and domain-containing protein n=1 Tax=Nannochloropsis gaditana (strain CCMP526) TaxID=1093141 RepID=UPI00029F6D12|nr:and domain-containing protein [Nannochloropsis gaditana CCMP526]EKU22478.1 and domain-containing protein [Nannochloropsis gaditana CCMP526]|eukprot:XP_005853881.1 and domain-containing protein [Nannochloropsis gaditana CCMP526]
MNYFIVKGHKELAESMARESGTAPPVDLQSIEVRMRIRKALMEGDVDAAIAHIMESDPMLLKKDQDLHFALHVQKLAEMLRCRLTPPEEKKEDDTTGSETTESKILAFARKELTLGEDTGTQGEKDGRSQSLKVVEEAMTLMVLGPTAAAAKATRQGGGRGVANGCKERYGLLDFSRRAATADRVNASILRSQGHDPQPVLQSICKRLRATEAELAKEMML